MRGVSKPDGAVRARWLTAEKNRSTLADLSGQWIDRVHARRPPRGVVLDMDSSVSPTHGEQEMSSGTGITSAPATIRCSCSTHFGDLERCALRPGNVHSADGWEGVLRPVLARYRGKVSRVYFRADAGFANPDDYEFLETERITYAIRLPPTASRKSGSATCSRARSRTKWGVATRTSPIRPEAGQSRSRSSPRSSGIGASPIRASDLSSPTWHCRECRRLSAARASNGSKRARERSNGRGCPVARSPPTRFVFSFMPSPIISATSYARWRRPNQSRIGRLQASMRNSSRLARRSCATAAMSPSRLPRSPFRDTFVDILRLIAELRPPPVRSTA
jgi:Transposase DDE domain group 1